MIYMSLAELIFLCYSLDKQRKEMSSSGNRFLNVLVKETTSEENRFLNILIKENPSAGTGFLNIHIY